MLKIILYWKVAQIFFLCVFIPQFYFNIGLAFRSHLTDENSSVDWFVSTHFIPRNLSHYEDINSKVVDKSLIAFKFYRIFSFFYKRTQNLYDCFEDLKTYIYKLYISLCYFRI